MRAIARQHSAATAGHLAMMSSAMMIHTPAWVCWYTLCCCPAAEAVRLISEAPKPGSIGCIRRITHGNVWVYTAPLQGTSVLSVQITMLVLCTVQSNARCSHCCCCCTKGSGEQMLKSLEPPPHSACQCGCYSAPVISKCNVKQPTPVSVRTWKHCTCLITCLEIFHCRCPVGQAQTRAPLLPITGPLVVIALIQALVQQKPKRRSHWHLCS
jgi:hypothetical protein